MPRRSRRDAVAERAEQGLAEQAERRREAAQRGAQTRRQRRAAPQGEAHPQPTAESLTQAHTARNRRERVHPEMVTVAIRGPLAEKMRELAGSTGLSLAKLLGDMMLTYQSDLAAGYELGTSLRRWQEGQGEERVG